MVWYLMLGMHGVTTMGCGRISYTSQYTTWHWYCEEVLVKLIPKMKNNGMLFLYKTNNPFQGTKNFIHGTYSENRQRIQWTLEHPLGQ
jgi:hypothetical protein